MLLTDVLLVLAGLAAGAVSGVLGVGGGLIFVPALTIGVGLGQTSAQGTSLAAILPTALVGAVTADRAGNVVRSHLVLMGVLAALGAAAGAVLALVVPTEVLVRVFGAFLIVSAWRLWRG